MEQNGGLFGVVGGKTFAPSSAAKPARSATPGPRGGHGAVHGGLKRRSSGRPAGRPVRPGA